VRLPPHPPPQTLAPTKNRTLNFPAPSVISTEARSGETPVLALVSALASALALAFAFALAFLAVIPQGSASSFAFAFAFLAVIPSAARNLLLARAASARSCLKLEARSLDPPSSTPAMCNPRPRRGYPELLPHCNTALFHAINAPASDVQPQARYVFASNCPLSYNHAARCTSTDS